MIVLCEEKNLIHILINLSSNILYTLLQIAYPRKFLLEIVCFRYNFKTPFLDAYLRKIQHNDVNL